MCLSYVPAPGWLDEVMSFGDVTNSREVVDGVSNYGISMDHDFTGPDATTGLAWSEDVPPGGETV